MEESPVAQLGRALTVGESLIVRVRPEQWGSATPCSQWSVRDLVTHLVRGNRLFADALRGAARGGPAGSADDASDAGAADAGVADSGADLPAAYRMSSESLVEAFGHPGALQQMVAVPFGTVPGIVALHLRITEALVHSWDLSRAIGQDPAWPDDLAEQELAFTRGKLADIAPGRSPFGPAQPVADDAPAIHRLAALLGRSITGASFSAASSLAQ